jgi:hypothetical protein
VSHGVVRGWRKLATAFVVAVFVGAPLALVVVLPPQFAHPDSVSTSRDPAIAIRALRADLIERLKVAPRVVVLGGSRATRIDPAYITAKTGASAFNASVFGARPEDAWAFVNLLHSRFPNAHFRFIWVIHADYFGGQNPARVLLEDPLLSQYFPPTFVARWAQRLNVTPKTFPLVAQAQDMVIVANGQTVHSPMDVAALTEPLARRVKATIDTSLKAYASMPSQLQPTYLAAVRAHGWSVRHTLVVDLVRRMQARFHFDFLDLSRAASVGAPAHGFYDGIHLTASTSRLVVAKIIKVFPRVL